MDKLVSTTKERFHNPEAYTRDQWVKKNADSLPRQSWVLDVGAGASKYRPFFPHCRYETQDFCAYSGPLVKYLEPITYVSDVTSIPVPDSSLDAILCTEVMEHVVDPMSMLSEFKRILKPGGRLLLSAPLLSHLHMEPYHFYGGFTHYWYTYWLPKNGFEVDSITPVGGPGRTAAYYGFAFYRAWSVAERQWPALPRAFSMVSRVPAKLTFHYFLPWLLPKLDRYLDANSLCTGYMVAGIRSPEN